MNKKESEELTNSMMVADALLRLRTLEKLLVGKGVFTQEEFDEQMESIAKDVAKAILQKANVKGDIDELVNSLKAAKIKAPTEN